jgi:hypothetical protein
MRTMPSISGRPGLFEDPLPHSLPLPVGENQDLERLPAI